MTLGDIIGWLGLMTVVIFIYALIYLIIAKARSIEPRPERQWMAYVIKHENLEERVIENVRLHKESNEKD